MFKVKICGVRLKSDIDAVATAGGDAIGLNFYDASIRYVDPAAAASSELSRHAATRGLLRVGVFVNVTTERASTIAEHVGLDALQLHGDEPLQVAQELCLQGATVIRAIKLPTHGLTCAMIDELSGPWHDAGCHLLLDADAGSSHGGSGQCLDWLVVARWSQSRPNVAWSLAGGLTADNVQQAITQSHATSVDTASGVEQPRGTKSPERIKAFVTRSLAAI